MIGAGKAAASAIDPGNERRSVAWLGRSVVVKGALTSSEDLLISGQVEGEITATNHGVVIGSQAKIRADIQARSVTVHGHVVGRITAGERLEIGASGSVDGDVTAPRLAVAEGGMIQGRVTVQRASAAGQEGAEG